MEWIRDVLQWFNDNYTLLIVIIALAYSLYRKTKSFFSKSKEEQLSLIKSEVHGRILKMITDAEMDYLDFESAGEIKRSQVISEIYTEYPELSKLISEADLIKWIDYEIDNALVTLRKILEENKASE